MKNTQNQNKVKNPLEDYNHWKEGYTDGINMLGNFLKVIDNVEDKNLRAVIKMLRKQWSEYGKDTKQE